MWIYGEMSKNLYKTMLNLKIMIDNNIKNYILRIIIVELIHIA